ncbi:MAG TPA: DUF2142 domain-containing protein [Anaerolineales bacterium]|nr:DUF2142 domain-containing protein [Anaerolineales bacterium]
MNKKVFSLIKSLHVAEIYLVIVLLLFGGLVCFLLPISGGYDEETHLMRIWEMSALKFIPNDALGQALPFPAVYWEMSYRRQAIVRPVERDFWQKYGRLSLDAHDYIYRGVETRSVYSPPLLLPQAIIMRYLGRKFQLPALTVYYAIRLVGLLSFLLLAWLSVRIIPFGKWTLAILASSPVAILQASSISADAISNGIAFLFIAATLAIANREQVGRREWMALAVLFFILFWGKLNLVPLALLPFLIIRPSQFQSRRAYLALLAATIILFLVEVLGWNILAYSRLSTPPEGTSPLGQVGFMLSHPLKFLSILAKNIWTQGLDYFFAWIAIYGFSYWPVPTLVYPIYILALIATLFVEKSEINKDTRRGLLITFLITYLATIISLYLTFNPVGSERIEGVQGRYFVTVMPLLFLTLVGLPAFKRIHIPASILPLLGGTSLLLYTAGMYLSYYVVCGSQYYRTDLCYQPNYKNWSPNDLYSSPISAQLTLRQEIVSECDGMTELRIWINAKEAEPEAFTQFILADVQEGSEVLRVNVRNSELPSGDWFSLKFEPRWNSKGKFYLLTIRSEQSNTRGPQIALSLRPEYLEGKLYENDQPVNRDILFQTGCIAGWNKIRLTGSP